ncbi:hypothetical protein C2G38_2206261 [Gigaspora rosea]|uniref:Uncharacterized protein n=1 Tax=Gigaspora rosea TaxID=44941 RepID=A0A397USF0_9GLOM|nr:hypothetical protein C2G38_2206261 [Gigaspora rosea]CAG8471596.1 4628_t:CDS:2 [Gigaspora rosea]
MGISDEIVEIKNHSVIWDYKLLNSTKLIIGKDRYLMPCELCLSIKQELNGGKKKLIVLGSYRLTFPSVSEPFFDI